MLAKRPVTLSLARPFSGLLELSDVALCVREKDDLPGGKFFRVAERGMRWARGGEPLSFQRLRNGNFRQHIPPITLFGFGTIEKKHEPLGDVSEKILQAD